MGYGPTTLLRGLSYWRPLGQFQCVGGKSADDHGTSELGADADQVTTGGTFYRQLLT